MNDADVEDFLEHYGVKGMKWGVRRDMRKLNKASRAKDKAKRQSEIDAARKRLGSGKNKEALKKAKAQYKIDKYEIGSREARKLVDKHKEKIRSDYETSKQLKNGKEVALAMVIGQEGVALLKIREHVK